MLNKKLKKLIGHKIKIARVSSNLTQADLANKLGVHSTNISLWETGSTTPNGYHIQQITTICKTDENYLELNNEDLIPSKYKKYNLDNIGELIKVIRYKLYLTQIDIASYLKVTKQIVSLWELNQSKVPIKKLEFLLTYFESIWNKYDRTFFFMFRDLVYHIKKEVSFIEYISYLNLSFKEYASIVKDTINYGRDYYSKIDFTTQGMVLTSTEILEIYNQNKFESKKLEMYKVEKILSNLFWYIANFCNLNDLKISNILKRSIEDLKLKYPDKIPNNIVEIEKKDDSK